MGFWCQTHVGIYGQQQHRQYRGSAKALFLCCLWSYWWGGQGVDTTPVPVPWVCDVFGLRYGDSPGPVQ